MKYYNRKELGNIGEKVATRFLLERNLEILENNFYCKNGEIDIIAKDHKEIVFIEVKTRRNKKFGRPLEAVNYIKQKHMKETARYFLYKNNLENELIRFDVIEIFFIKGKFKINHIKQIF